MSAPAPAPRAAVFDTSTNKFTDYELVFASCEAPAATDGYQSSDFQIRGRIKVAQPTDIDLTDMHSMLSNAGERPVASANWTDLRFHLSMGSPCGTNDDGSQYWCQNTQTGRSVYEKYEAVGCAKAMENSGEVSMCFNDGTLKSAYPSSGGGSYQGVRPACKSRLQTYVLSAPRYYRAYKLCDDDACSGTHDCKESGPTNNVNFYTCKVGSTRSDGTPGCAYKDRAVQGYLHVWSAEQGAHLWSYPAYHYQEEWDQPFPPSMPPPPPSPPPEEAVAYIPEFPDGTEVWKEEYTSDDKKYTVRRTHGRLVRVRQNSMRLCDMPGTYTVENSGRKTVSFEVDVVGACDGTLKVREGLEAKEIFSVSREHLDRYLSPERPQYAVLTNGQSGGAQYRLPVQTEYWQLIELDCVYNTTTWACVPDKAFAATHIAKGTEIVGRYNEYVYGESSGSIPSPSLDCSVLLSPCCSPPAALPLAALPLLLSRRCIASSCCCSRR